VHAAVPDLPGQHHRERRALAAEAAADPDAAGLIRDRFIARRRAALNLVLERAAARGELTRGDAEIMLDLIYGSLWYRLIFDIAPLDTGWADAITQAFATKP